VVLRVIPVNVTMIVRRKYLVITGTGTLLETPVASIMVEWTGRLVEDDGDPKSTAPLPAQ